MSELICCFAADCEHALANDCRHSVPHEEEDSCSQPTLCHDYHLPVQAKCIPVEQKKEEVE